MFSRPKILFLVSLLFVALLNSIPTYLLNFQFFYQSIYMQDSEDQLRGELFIELDISMMEEEAHEEYT